MLHPLPLDLLSTAWPPGVGLLAFAAGKALHRLPVFLRRGILAGVLLFLAILVAASFTRLDDWTGPLLYRPGETVLACLAALLLLGVVWGQPRRSTSSGFLVALIGLAEVVLVVEAGGRLWWRFDTQTWQNTADARGCVRQTTGLTCGPAAAVMLLHQHGISVSEGELAYQADTSLLLGTDLYCLAQALNARGRDRGWSAEVERVEYETWVARGEPFVAHTYLPGLGGHALYVRRLTPDHAEVVDPRFGQPDKVSRAEFLRLWKGRALRLRRTDP